MSTEMQTKVQASPAQNFTPVQTGLLQRKSALCNTPGLVEDSGRDKEKLTLQRSSADQAGTTTVPRFGHDFSRVRVHSTGQEMIQTKLKINEPGDIYEQEADRVADQVMRMPDPVPFPQSPVNSHPEGSSIQSAGYYHEKDIQRKEDNYKEKGIVQMKQGSLASGVGGQSSGAVPPILHEVLHLPGVPLDPATRTYMEPRFGHDFSRVRVHTGALAEQSAQDINAKAYTMGHAIVFDAGRFAPGTQEGRRLIAHELTHVVQQSGVEGFYTAKDNEKRDPFPIESRSPTGVIQREVNPKRIASKEAVLAKIKNIADSSGKGKEPAEANLARLGKLGIGFNPGATKEEKDNAFVYTCHCGWIDMGHFFISAALAYGVGYQRRRLEIRVEGIPRTIDDLLAVGLDKLTPELDLLLKTVPGNQGRNVLSDVRKLLKSGEPRDIALTFGYWMEFVQQVAKVVSDPGNNFPDGLKQWLKDYQRMVKSVAPEWLEGTIEGSARSAFTMEDLPSDCYGAAFGQDVWKQTDGAKMDSSPIHGLMKEFFSECGAVFPEPRSRTRCEMMAETTPGSCRMEGGEDKWPEDLGEPARYASTKPKLLRTAEPLCKNKSPKVLPCKTGTGSAGSPMPAAELDVSWKDKSATLTLFENFPLYQPEERGEFGGGVRIPGRSELIDKKPPLVLRAPSFLRINARGDVIAYSTLGGVPSLGDMKSSAHLNLASGRFQVQAKGPLQIDVEGKVNIDFEKLFMGLAGPEIDQLKEILKSDEFTDLVKKVLNGQLGSKKFVSEVKSLLQRQFPQGFKGVVATVLARLENLEALALATSLDAHGTVSVGGIPISGFIFHKSVGMNPLLGLEGGLLISELAKERVIFGAKGLLYGDRLLQARLTVGVDPIGHKAIAELHAVNKTLTRNKLSLDLQYQINPEGEQQFLVIIGGKHNIWGSKSIAP